MEEDLIDYRGQNGEELHTFDRRSKTDCGRRQHLRACGAPCHHVLLTLRRDIFLGPAFSMICMLGRHLGGWGWSDYALLCECCLRG